MEMSTLPGIALNRSSGVTQCPAANWGRNCHGNYTTAVYLYHYVDQACLTFHCGARKWFADLFLDLKFTLDHDSGPYESPRASSSGDIFRRGPTLPFAGVYHRVLYTAHHGSVHQYCMLSSIVYHKYSILCTTAACTHMCDTMDRTDADSMTR